MVYNDRILVIDDDPDILRIFKTALGRCGQPSGSPAGELEGLLFGGSPAAEATRRPGFTVDTALQGEEGAAMVERARCELGRPYSVVFIDMRMPPGWNGIRTAQTIRRLDPDVQVVIVTAYSDATIADIVDKVGFTDRLLYLKKPFDDEEILQLADSLAARWNLERRVQGVIGIMGGILGSLADLTPTEDDQTLKKSFAAMLHQIGGFLDTPDLFLASVDEQVIQFKVGVGRFAAGITELPIFQEIVHRIMADERVTEIFSVDEYVVMPLVCGKWRNVVIGIRPARDIKGTGELLKLLAVNAAKIFDLGTMIRAYRQEIETLQEAVRRLEGGQGGRKIDSYGK